MAHSALFGLLCGWSSLLSASLLHELKASCLASYGIRYFDTSPYYGASEIILGALLPTLAPEFPRESYKIVCLFLTLIR
jgi:hypothetical protein